MTDDSKQQASARDNSAAATGGGIAVAGHKNIVVRTLGDVAIHLGVGWWQMLIVGLVIGLTIVVSGAAITYQLVAKPHLLFDKAKPDESLIILTSYAGRMTGIEFSPERLVRDALQKRVDDLQRQGQQIRLEVLPQVVMTEREARDIGELYQATLVIWGEFDDVVGVRTYVEILPTLPLIGLQQGGGFLTFPPYLPGQTTVSADSALPAGDLRLCLANDMPRLADYCVLLSLGLLDLTRSSLESAEANLAAAVQAASAPGICRWNQDQAYYWLGVTRLRTEHYAEAADDLKQAASLNPDSWPALAQLGSARLALGQVATDVLRLALDAIPAEDVDNRLIVQTNLCLAQAAPGTFEQTVACYQAVESEMAGQDVSPQVRILLLVQLANQYYLRQDYDQADALYDEALTHAGSDWPLEKALIEENKGLVALQREEYQAAQQHFDRARVLYDKNAHPVGLARLSVRLGMLDYKQTKPCAAAQLEAALALAQQASSAYYQAWAYIGLGLVAQQNGDLPAGCEYFGRALALLTELNSPDVAIVEKHRSAAGCEPISRMAVW